MPVVSYFKFEKEGVSKFGQVSKLVRKIAINPFSHHSFIAIGYKFVRNYLANDKKKQFKEDKDAVIPKKYENTNNFTDIKYMPDSHAFIVVSSECNIFIINGKSVIYVTYTQSPTVVLEVTNKTSPTDAIEAEPITLENIDLIVETHKKGFIVGTNHKFGFFNIYEITKEYEVTLIQSFRFSSY